MTTILSTALSVVAVLMIVFALVCLGIAAFSAWHQQVKRFLCFLLLAAVAAPSSLLCFGLAAGTRDSQQDPYAGIANPE